MKKSQPTSAQTLAIWGSTGSIGTQTLEVIRNFPDRFQVGLLTARSNAELLYRQAREFHPQWVVLTDESLKIEWESAFAALGVKTLWGRSGLLEAAAMEVDLVVNALVGSVGLEATLKAVDAGAHMALANKEVLVMAGELVTRAFRQKKRHLIPVDSEHSAIFQCLQGEPEHALRKIILTASGGPFLRRDPATFSSVTPEEALAHPNWSMGRKVSLDSATMVNKGLEVVEARWLFDVPPEKIEVVIHPQSIVHSMVEFCDGSVKSQLGVPDMRTPIAYALTWPDRWPGDYGFMDFSSAHTLEFFPPDPARFPSLNLAFAALRAGGTAPAVFNGADEAAVTLFLNGRIRFDHIPRLIEEALTRHDTEPADTLERILKADVWAKEYVNQRSKEIQ